MSTGIQITGHLRHRSKDGQLIGRSRPQAGPGTFEIDLRQLRNTANCALHQAVDFREGVADVEALIFGGAADQDFAVVLLRHVAITGGQATLQQLGHALGENDLALHRRNRNAQACGLFTEFSCPGTGGIDQGLAMKGAFFGGQHTTDPRTLVQHTGDIGVVEKIHTILARGFHIGIRQAEWADLVITEKLQSTTRLMADRRFRPAQGLAIEPVHLLGQVRDLRDDVFGVQLVFIVVDHILQACAFELEVHAVTLDQLLVQLWIKCIGLQGKVEKRLRQDMRRTGIHGHGSTVCLALMLGRHHPKENHPAAQANRLTYRP
ncbi:hypothetical protein D3C79_713210 [compost metagenome]